MYLNHSVTPGSVAIRLAGARFCSPLAPGGLAGLPPGPVNQVLRIHG